MSLRAESVDGKYDDFTNDNSQCVVLFIIIINSCKLLSLECVISTFVDMEKKEEKKLKEKRKETIFQWTKNNIF